MSRLTWLHISDWHHGDFSIDPEVVRDELIKDIQGRLSISPDLSKINFIVFSGDAALNGTAKEYEDAKKEFFVPILEAAQVEPDRLFIVPGNHDLDEEEIKRLPDDFRKDVVSKEDADRWLKDDSKRELLLLPFKDFRSFVSGFTGQESPDYSDVQPWEIDGKTVSLLGINSSWFCRRHVDEASGKQSDYRFARVGERQVHKRLDRIRKSDLRIAVLHHSQDWLEHSDGEVVWRRLRRGCNFILHGHGHVPKVTAEHGTGGDCVIIPAGASFERRTPKDLSHINSYNFVHIDFETGKCFVFLRRWIDERSVWDKDIQTYPEGKFPFDLPGHSTAPHQIPCPPEDFIGRSDLIEKLLAGFQGGATIAGLRGMGGEGKTALALVLAKKLAESYTDGQLFLNMQGTSKNPIKPEDAMAHVIRSYKGADALLPKDLNGLSGLYQTVLSGKKVLILLDNAVGREQVESLLPPTGSALLITSRNKFAFAGLLEEMDLDPGALLLEDAKKLLLKICGRIGDHAGELAEICGCLPIALRNAASILREKSNLSVASYVKRLSDSGMRLELVEASFNLNYDILNPELQRLWSLLSVFPADFDLAGAAAVWEMEEMLAEDILGELWKWSLIDFVSSTTGEVGRYRLHDLARDFAGSRLEADARELAQQRHSKHYQELLWRANNQFLMGGESQSEGLTLFDAEWINIEVGQKWAAINSEKSNEIAGICSNYSGAWDILHLRLHPRQYINWLDKGIDLSHKTKNKEYECAHLGDLGIVYKDLGDLHQAIENYNHALKISQEICDRRAEGKQLGNLGVAYSILGESQKAVKCWKRALIISREIGDRKIEGKTVGNLGNAYFSLNQPDKAIKCYNHALEILSEIPDQITEGTTLGNLGNSYLLLEKPIEAIEYYEQALKIARVIGDRREEGLWLFNMSRSLHKLNQRKEAIDMAKSALAIFEEIESPHVETVRKQLAEWGG